ncbi:MAG: hypothetical protein V4655_07295 [Bdellovibrionota bacterium]|nr:MAG: hypothetical protein EOP10_21250 [Pseudomonadota bacterium]
MDSVLRRDGFATWKEIARSWRPRPNSGSLPKDMIFVLLLVFAQTTIFPTLFGSFGIFDLVTPWIVVTSVRQRPLQGTIIALVAAFALETKLAVPAGIYLCSYWIMINVFFQMRPALSWRYRTPWVVSYAVSALWIALFETFVLAFHHETWNFSTTYVLQEIFKIALATGFGMYLSSEWMRIDAEEPVPQ